MPLPPPHFPPLPYSPLGGWSPNVRAAHSQICNVYGSALQVLGQEDSDPMRISFHIDTISSQALLLLEALEAEGNSNPDQRLPEDWLHDGARCLGDLVANLHTVKEAAIGRDDTDVIVPELVSILHTRKRGRPRKVLDLNFLQEAMSSDRQIKKQEIADLLGIHRNTLYLFLKRHNILNEYSKLSTADLDILTRTFKRQRPESGLRYLVGFLRTHGHRVQRRRVRASLRRVDGLGETLRKQRTIKRRTYGVKRPHSMWHLDGHHKLIRWGIVIHGFVDGYSRLITALKASTNNRSVTVLELFLEAIKEHGKPSRLRADRGSENLAVSIYMIMKNGPNRASFIWGSSTHNTRIERLWVEVGTQFVRRWRVFFQRLERLHSLDPNRPEHLWLLHFLFLDEINQDAADFQRVWNAHPIDGPQGGQKSPNDLVMLGGAKLGVYRDECDGIHPDTITKYYGTHGRSQRLEGETGAGHPPDERASDIADKIHVQQDRNIKHDAVDVPNHANPFSSQPESEAIFRSVLKEVIEQEVVPAGYGIRPNEWDNDAYPDTEDLIVGGKRQAITLSLRDPIWKARATRWVQGLAVLTQFNL